MATIIEDYVSFETAKLLKEKGLYQASDKYYNKKGRLSTFEPNFLEEEWWPAYTLQMVMKWLREEKGIAIIPIISSILDSEKFLWDVKIVVAKTNDSYSQGWVYEKQENACESAIKYCIKHLI